VLFKPFLIFEFFLFFFSSISPQKQEFQNIKLKVNTIFFSCFFLCFLKFNCFYFRFSALKDCVIQQTLHLNCVWEIPGSNPSRFTVLKFIILLSLGGSGFDFLPLNRLSRIFSCSSVWEVASSNVGRYPDCPDVLCCPQPVTTNYGAVF